MARSKYFYKRTEDSTYSDFTDFRDQRDLEEVLGDWDMLPTWIRVLLILFLPFAILFAYFITKG